MISETIDININHVSETALLMVLCHSLDARSNNSILDDQSSINVLRILQHNIGDSRSRIHKIINKEKIDKFLASYICFRARHYDQEIRDYISMFPDATIVNIGCGLDQRFDRIDNGKIEFYDIDFPDIINIKKHFSTETDRYHQISKSVFDFSWMGRIESDHVLFIAEGVFMYCDESDIRRLFLEITNRFPDSEMHCEMYNSRWLKNPIAKVSEFQKRLQYGIGENANFKFGIRNGSDLEKWHAGIQCIGEWSVVDTADPRLGPLRYLRHSDLFRKLFWTVHYQFLQ
jgi:O-methyltransferase involved in polyketide biosynthesis